MFSLEIRGTVYTEETDIKGCHCKQSGQDFEGVISPFYHPKMTDTQAKGGTCHAQKVFTINFKPETLYFSSCSKKFF